MKTKDKTPKPHDRDPEADHILDTVMDLHARVAKIRPGLIVSVKFGDKLRHPTHIKGEDDFRDFANQPSEPFVNSFDKVGDGFINIHGIDLEKGFEVLPEFRNRIKE